ncbi:unnamed protein product [Rhizophagus irregularis]|nr:unnamed protein product [Rhizophagus irregularis]
MVVSASAYISFNLSFRLVCIGFDFDFGSVNFDITTLNRYVSALCFDAFKLSTLNTGFFLCNLDRCQLNFLFFLDGWAFRRVKFGVFLVVSSIPSFGVRVKIYE